MPATATAQLDPLVAEATANPGLPRAQTHRGSPSEAFPDSDFVCFPNIPVFAEHETTARNGRRLRFTRVELEQIAERCNRRIYETGDYAAITIGHTPDPQAAAGGAVQQPEIIGFAGPFRIGLIGAAGGRQRYAILCDFHVFREDAGKIRKYPRRSPELWLEERYADMFLDPIALLGAEPPRLDMGLLYAATVHGRHREKYTAVAPAAANVFVPTDESVRGTSTPRRQSYAADDAPQAGGASKPGAKSMLSPEDIQQIVDAIEAQDWVQQVKAMLASQGAGANSDDPLPGDDIGGGDGDQLNDAPPSSAAAAPPPAPGGLPGGAAGGPPPTGAPEGGPVPREPMGAGGAKGLYSRGRHGSGHRMNGRDLNPAALLDRVAKLTEQVEAERAARVDQERYSRLNELADQYDFDPDEEIELCRYGRMSAENFTAHCERIERYFRPQTITLPERATHGPPMGRGERLTAARQNPEKYAKAATAWCEAQIAADPNARPDYNAALERARRGEL